MESKLYKQELKVGILNQKKFLVRDYFEYYTTGIEKVIADNPHNYVITSRENAESAENIMYDMFGDPDLADTFVALNNQNYLWATPFDLNAFNDAIDFRMNYISLMMRDRIIKYPNDPVTDEPPEHPYNIVGQECYDKASVDIHNEDDKARSIIVPDASKIQAVQKQIRDYLEARKVL